MKVLWFTNTPSNYKRGGSAYNGGGWISSLEEHIKDVEDITLGIAFIHSDTCFKALGNHVTYYPIRRNMSLMAKAKRFFCIRSQDDLDLALCIKVIDDFKPDIIHVFGTESCFGLLCKHVGIPVVIHLQGLMAPYINAWVPPFYTLMDYFISDGWSPKKIAFKLRAWHFNKYAAKRELEIMKSCKFFMGRTEWDKSYTKLYAPQATYYHCDEMLRNAFYEPSSRTIPLHPCFVSTLSGPLYKGHDLVLKTAKVLKETGLTDFEWNIYGISSMHFAERKTKNRATDVNVFCKGVATAEQLKDALLTCTAYVHPSYIDNSPNSVCEAQILGIPVVATNVGGLSSLIHNDETGVLVPTNDPIALASELVRLVNSESKTSSTVEMALNRHSKLQIVNQLISIYEKLIVG